MPRHSHFVAIALVTCISGYAVMVFAFRMTIPIMIAAALLNASLSGTDRSARATAADSSLPTNQRTGAGHGNIRGKLAAGRDSNNRKPESRHDVCN